MSLTLKRRDIIKSLPLVLLGLAFQSETQWTYGAVYPSGISYRPYNVLVMIGNETDMYSFLNNNLNATYLFGWENTNWVEMIDAIFNPKVYLPMVF